MRGVHWPTTTRARRVTANSPLLTSIVHQSSPPHPPPPTKFALPYKPLHRQLGSMSAAPESSTISSPPAKRVKTTNDMDNTAAPPALQVKKLSDKGRVPTRGSALAAGYDIYAAKDTTVPARGKVLVDTDIAIAVPEGTCKYRLASASSRSKFPPGQMPILTLPLDGRIAPRSGLASKNFIDTGAGVIDADYRGQVKVLLFNHAETDYEIKEGDRIAQLVLERIFTPEVVEVEELSDSVRGAGGFGSTG
jgi:dUTP pyrophosphatase